ncbi:MAG: hypothetical protein JW783_02695 [Bacteroidales bacterium]|nr:hypothetical protein [Bacteroidales bacterium]MBN2749794.1 hypothetical protein [Bacteroidales bacterium]
MKKSLWFLVFLFVAHSFVSAQEKKVAVVTFYANKYVGTGQLSDGGSNASLIAALAKDPDFNLTGIVDDFHAAFFNEYAKLFPFTVVDEAVVLQNQAYKDYVTTDTSSILYYNSLLYPGYNLYMVSRLYKKDLRKMIEIFGNDIDGFLFVEVGFNFAPKFAIGGVGVCGISAFTTMSLWKKDEGKVFSITESAMSKSTVGMAGGFPVIDTKDILPMCKEASGLLLEDLNKRMPKIIKKAAKKF